VLEITEPATEARSGVCLPETMAGAPLRDDGSIDSDAGEASTLDVSGTITPDPFLAAVGRIPGRGSSPSGDAALAAGESIGHFTILREIGRGGMGVVYAAEDQTLGRTVALKVLPASDEAEPRRRFLREARAAASLSHAGIATLYEIGEESGRVYIAMELVRGRTLRARMDAGDLPVSEALAVARDIARALARAHERGVVHRDLKPENVMIADDGQVKLLDFGLAKPIVSTDVGASSATTATETGRILGTPSYMSPEQAKGRSVDARSDVFSFGVMLYEMLTGKRPFTGATVVELFIALDRDEPKPPSRVNPRVSAAVERVVLRCLRKDPAARYRDAGALLADLDPAARRVGRPRSAAVAVIGALAIAVAALVAFAVRHRTPPRPTVARTTILDLPTPTSGKPEAIAAYRAALASMREGGPWEDAMLGVLEIDPDLAEAHVQLTIAAIGHIMDPARAHYRKAYARREVLHERDRAMLDALEPLVQRQPADWAESARRFQAAVDRYPGDAELWHLLGLVRANWDDFEADVRCQNKALEIDPRFADALHSQAMALAYLGRFDESRRLLDRCVAEFPNAMSCFHLISTLEANRGACEAVEGVARRMIAGGGPHPGAYVLLAEAFAARGRPMSTLREAVRQADEGWSQSPAMNESVRKQKRESLDVKLALFEGDFDAALRGVQSCAPNLEKSRQRDDHGRLAAWLAQIYQETGRDQEAGRAAMDFLDRSDAWEPAPGVEDIAMANDFTPFLLVAATKAGALARPDFEARREAWRSSWLAKMTPVTRNFLWLHGYAKTVAGPDDARAAMEALPRYEPLPPFRPLTLVAGDVGRAFLEAGRVDDAIPWLEHAANHCLALSFAFDSTRAHRFLGEAREKKGDKAGACAAYGVVLARWGQAKPRSVTAEIARARSKALGCGGA
jgi:serine/threonine-protein kinase